MPEIDQRRVFRAREAFHADGFLEPELERTVRPSILASWRRSAMSGADATISSMAGGTQVNVEAHLYRAAEPVLEQLAQRLSGLPAGVLLADRDALIIQQWVSEPEISHELDRINSWSGSSASEEYIGTNGVGTVLELRKPQVIVGAEHYAEMVSNFLCVGAPIFHPMTRRFEGVVTLSSEPDCASPLLSALVAGTTHEIERRLFETASRPERQLFETFLTMSRNARPVAVVGDDLFLAGPSAVRAFDGIDHAAVWCYVRANLSPTAASQFVDVPVGDRNVTLTCTPVLSGNSIIGVTVEPASPGHGRTRRAGSHRSVPLLLAEDWAAGHELQQGRSNPAFLDAVHLGGLHRAAQTPTVLTGETGTGKLRLAGAMLGRHSLHSGDSVVLDCLEGTDPPDGWLEHMVDVVTRPGGPAVVLRHLDALPPDVMARLSVEVDDLRSREDPPWLLATAASTDRADNDPVFRRLLDQLGAQQIELPPLRACREDIPNLVHALNAHYSMPAPLHFLPATLHMLQLAPWPGNVRQLANVVRSLARANPGGQIAPEMLPPEVTIRVPGRSMSKLEQIEYDTIVATLHLTSGNKVQTARVLGVSRSTLYRKLRAYHLEPDRGFF